MKSKEIKKQAALTKQPEVLQMNDKHNEAIRVCRDMRAAAAEMDLTNANDRAAVIWLIQEAEIMKRKVFFRNKLGQIYEETTFWKFVTQNRFERD